MVIVFKSEPKARCGHCKALPRVDLNVPARLYVGHLMTHYGLCSSSVYAHLKRGLLPPPDGTYGHRQYWKTSTIKADLEK